MIQKSTYSRVSIWPGCRQMRISKFPKNWVFAKIPWVFGEKSLSFCTLLRFWVKNCWVLLNHSVFKQFFWLVSWQCSFNIWILFKVLKFSENFPKGWVLQILFSFREKMSWVFPKMGLSFGIFALDFLKKSQMETLN